MSERRKRRPTELRLDHMAKVSDDLGEDEAEAGACPKCQGRLVGSRLEVEGGGHVRVLRCQDCGYVYMKRS